MAHHRECLPLGVEAGDHLAGVHPELYHLKCYSATNRLFLFGHVNRAAAASSKSETRMRNLSSSRQLSLEWRARSFTGNCNAALNRSTARLGKSVIRRIFPSFNAKCDRKKSANS